MVDFNYSLMGTGNVGTSPSENVDTEFPQAYLAMASGTAKFKLSDSVSLNFEAGLWGGYHNQLPDRSAPSQSSLLRWYEDRWVVFMTRTPFSPKDNVFGINELSATLSYDPWGLALTLAPFSAVEKRAYPYAHNAAGGFPSLQLAGFDTNAPADVYGPFIGPLAALTWDVPFAPGLQFLAQVGTAGPATGTGESASEGLDGAFDFSKLFQTVQAKYTHSFKDGATLTGAVYFMNRDPASPVTSTGETLSSTLGVGAGLILNIPDILAANLGYSFNTTDRDGEGVHINSRFDGVNVSIDVPIAGVLHLVGGYSWLGFTEETDAFTATIEETSEHAVEARIVLPLPERVLKNHLGLSVGYRGTFVDQDNNLDPIGGNRHVVSLSLTGLFGGSNAE